MKNLSYGTDEKRGQIIKTNRNDVLTVGMYTADWIAKVHAWKTPVNET